ncbi:MAG TPA: DUF5985 family protein, partial [Clostridia bacterium]|nr:DUF5985 family protein [Clostridia bacterium]
TRDPLFGFFSVAFFLLAAERVCIVAFASELHYLIYLIRLGAFLMIAFAIVQKNRSRRRQAPTATPPKNSSLPPTVHRS